MVEGTGGLYGRAFLEAFLGSGRLSRWDSSKPDRIDVVRFRCGCTAQPETAKLFRLVPCERHGHLTHEVRPVVGV